LPWARHDILDAATAKILGAKSFVGWEDGQPFYQIGANEAVLMIGEEPILENYISIDGAIPFYNGGRSRILFRTPN
jgi:hypothetical protein